MLLSELYQLYEGDKRLEFSAYTLKGYAIQARLLLRHFGDVDASTITTDLLKAYLTKDADRLKPSTIGHRVRFLKSLFRFALEEGYVVPNPAARLREPRQGHRVPKALSEEDVELLRDACKMPIERALIELLYSTGCRIGEIQKLNRNSIDWETRSIIVRGKGPGGGKEREVYFNVKCAIWLKRYLREREDTDIALFVTERNPHHRSSIAQLRHVIKRVAKRAGIEVNVYPHVMRHSFATHLLNNGAPLEVVQEFLGHAKLETTRIYAQLSGERRRELYRKYF